MQNNSQNNKLRYNIHTSFTNSVERQDFFFRSWCPWKVSWFCTLVVLFRFLSNSTVLLTISLNLLLAIFHSKLVNLAILWLKKKAGENIITSRVKIISKAANAKINLFVEITSYLGQCTVHRIVCPELRLAVCCNGWRRGCLYQGSGRGDVWAFLVDGTPSGMGRFEHVVHFSRHDFPSARKPERKTGVLLSLP